MKKKSAGEKREKIDSNGSDPNSENNDLVSQMETESTLSDASLESLLRDVAVPTDLESQLMEIPSLGLESIDVSEESILKNALEQRRTEQQERALTLDSQQQRLRSGAKPYSRLAIALSLVASVSVVGILAIGFMLSLIDGGASRVGDIGSEKEPLKQRRTESGDLTKQRTNGSKPVNPENAIDAQVELQLAATDDAITSANLRLQQLEIARLKAKLRTLESNARPRISNREFESIALAVAAEATQNFGGSEELVRMQYVSVIEKYPSSRGSKIAIQNLDDGRLH